jgi:hypothetical protein
MRDLLAAMIFVACTTSIHAQSLDQQERCAQQARRAFLELDAQFRNEGKRLGTKRITGDYQREPVPEICTGR